MEQAPDVYGVTPDNRVAVITEIYAHASTFPCKVVTEAGTQWVMKLCGSGPGAMSLLTEFLALRAAAAMGLAVPSARPLYLPPGFPWMIGTDEFDGIVQRSYGWNLGIAYVDQAVPAGPEEIVSADPDFLDCLCDVDRALTNMDRSLRNPNVLQTPHGLVAIDFDACLFLRRAAQAVVPSAFPMPAGHLLADRALPVRRCKVDVEGMIEALHEASPSWLNLLSLDATALAAHLRAYFAGWNAE